MVLLIHKSEFDCFGLMSMSYFCGQVDGDLAELSRKALKTFWRHHHLEEGRDGEMDDATQSRLKETAIA